MAGLTVSYDGSDVGVHLAALDDDIRAAEIAAEETLVQELIERASARAPVRTGKLRRSINGEVAGTPTGVWASVAIKDPIANILEGGAKIPPHVILPKVKDALHFVLGGDEVFASRVNSPGGVIAPREILHEPFAEMQQEIEDALAAAADGAVENF